MTQISESRKKEYRDLEKALEREAALTDSLERYIEALEGRDRERVEKIKELEAKNREAPETIGEPRTRFAGPRPNHKEEP